MGQVRVALEAIRTEYSASPKAKAILPSGQQNDFDMIPVQFSIEQLAVMSEVLGADKSGSCNVTSSIRSIMLSQPSDFVERKLAAPMGDGVAADAEADAN
jgi:hypothetical protein